MGGKRTLAHPDRLPIFVKPSHLLRNANDWGSADMILHRIKESLKRQDWTAVTLELVIVIIGVFIGTQVSNWNQARIEKRETEQLLLELRPALQYFADFFDSAKSYYATTRAYSDTAFAGWSGDPKVSDEQFVIAAYQASQLHVFNVNGENWTEIFGGDRLREIDNVDVRRGLTTLMTLRFDQIDQPAVDTPYRQHVRSVIPVDIQDAIRAECGDRPVDKSLLIIRLPPACDLDVPQSRFVSAAADLRTRPELVGELRWHRAAVAAFLVNLQIMDDQTRHLRQAIDRSVD